MFFFPNFTCYCCLVVKHFPSSMKRLFINLQVTGSIFISTFPFSLNTYPSPFDNQPLRFLARLSIKIHLSLTDPINKRFQDSANIYQWSVHRGCNIHYRTHLLPEENLPIKFSIAIIPLIKIYIV